MSARPLMSPGLQQITNADRRQVSQRATRLEPHRVCVRKLQLRGVLDHAGLPDRQQGREHGEHDERRRAPDRIVHS